MSHRIHTAGAGDISLPWYGNPCFYFDNDEMDVGDALVLDDARNQEALVLVGSPKDIGDFARRILDALPVVLTEDEHQYLTHICEMHEYDVGIGTIGRTVNGWATFTADEDDMSYDLTNEREREVSYDD
jgi:hypothetical protein